MSGNEKDPQPSADDRKSFYESVNLLIITLFAVRKPGYEESY